MIRIAKRASCEIEDGMVVSLGLGIPSLVENYLPQDFKVLVHSVSGVLGCGGVPD